MIEKAKQFAELAHAGQKRKYGDRDDIYHPEQVFLYLKKKGYNDPELLSAAWLHDVIEDCEITYEELTKEFSPAIADLVNEVSHPPTAGNRQQRWEIYLDHYNNASDSGKILKLADRVCNLREYILDWDILPVKAKRFLDKVYLDESAELMDYLSWIDIRIDEDLTEVINQIDNLLS